MPFIKPLPTIFYNLKPGTGGYKTSGGHMKGYGRNSPTVQLYAFENRVKMFDAYRGAKHDDWRSVKIYTDNNGGNSRWQSSMDFTNPGNSTSKDGNGIVWGIDNLCSRDSGETFNVEIYDKHQHETSHCFCCDDVYDKNNNANSTSVNLSKKSIAIPQVMGFSVRYSASGSNTNSTTGGLLYRVGLLFVERNSNKGDADDNYKYKNNVICLEPAQKIGNHPLSKDKSNISDSWKHISYVWSDGQWATLQSKLNPNSDNKSLLCIGVMIGGYFHPKMSSKVTMRLKLYDFNFICGDSPRALKSGTNWQYGTEKMLVVNTPTAGALRDYCDNTKSVAERGIIKYNDVVGSGYDY